MQIVGWLAGRPMECECALHINHVYEEHIECVRQSLPPQNKRFKHAYRDSTHHYTYFFKELNIGMRVCIVSFVS